MKFSMISFFLFISLSLLSMEHEKKILPVTTVVTTGTESRSTSARIAAVQVTMEQYNQRHNNHENCCKIVGRLFYNLPMAIVSLPIVWADEVLNNINEKLKVD